MKVNRKLPYYADNNSAKKITAHYGIYDGDDAMRGNITEERFHRTRSKLPGLSGAVLERVKG